MTLPYGRRAARYPFSPGAVQRATYSFPSPCGVVRASRPAFHPPAPNKTFPAAPDRQHTTPQALARRRRAQTRFGVAQRPGTERKRTSLEVSPEQ